MKKFMPVIFVAFVLGIMVTPLSAMEKEGIEVLERELEPEAEAGVRAGATRVGEAPAKPTMVQPKVLKQGDQGFVKAEVARIEAGRQAALKPTVEARPKIATPIGEGTPVIGKGEAPGIATRGETSEVMVIKSPTIEESTYQGDKEVPAGEGYSGSKYDMEAYNAYLKEHPTPEAPAELEPGAQSAPQAIVGGQNVGGQVVQPNAVNIGEEPRLAAGKPGEEPEVLLKPETPEGEPTGTAPKKMSLKKKVAAVAGGVVIGGLAGFGAYEIYEHNKPGTTSGKTVAKQAATGMGTDTGATPESMGTPQETGPQGGAVITPDETGMTPDETGLTPEQAAIIGITPDETGVGITPPVEEGTPVTEKKKKLGKEKLGKEKRAKTIQAGKRHEKFDNRAFEERERFLEEGEKPRAEAVKERGPKTRMGTEHPVEKRAIRKEMGVRKTVKKEMSE